MVALVDDPCETIRSLASDYIGWMKVEYRPGAERWQPWFGAHDASFSWPDDRKPLQGRERVSIDATSPDGVRWSVVIAAAPSSKPGQANLWFVEASF